MITKGKTPWSFIKFSRVILKKIYGDQFGEFVCGYWGLKGEELTLKQNNQTFKANKGIAMGESNGYNWQAKIQNF